MIKKYLTSYKTSVILLLIYAVVMAVATFVEYYFSTEIAQKFFYHAPLFFLIHLLLIINFILLLIRDDYIKKRRWALLIIHFAFIIILLGANVTFFFGKEGVIHLREGEQTNQMTVYSKGQEYLVDLPFSLKLEKFRMMNYPGTNMASSYESDLVLKHKDISKNVSISMNKVLDVEAYRLFQSSYDQDEKGTVLTVNKDIFGRTVSYIGYFFLIIGCVWMFFDKKSRFNRLNSELMKLKSTEKTALLIFFLVLMNIPVAEANQVTDSVKTNAISRIIPTEHAEKFGSLAIQYRGRVAPLNTLSSELLRKIHKKEKYKKFSSDQFLLSLLAMPQEWLEEPLIPVSNKDLKEYYAFDNPYISYKQAFDTSGNYLFSKKLKEALMKSPESRNETDKALLKLNEKISLIYQLLSYDWLKIYPTGTSKDKNWYAPSHVLLDIEQADSNFIKGSFAGYLSAINESLQTGDWSEADVALEQIKQFQFENDASLEISKNKFKLELIYNQLNIFSTTMILYLIVGVALLFMSLAIIFYKNRFTKLSLDILSFTVLIVLLYHTFGLILRWIIAGYAPWSNTYETLVYVSWITIFAGFVFIRKHVLALPLASIFGGIILLAASLNWLDPQITTLVPVLKSPWLTFHVAVLVAAYGFFGLSFMMGITNLLLSAFKNKHESLSLRIKELTIINNMSLLIGLVMIIVGTFLGAIWANESWGRYWGWDPKETWALITIVIYTIVTHIHLIKKDMPDWVINLLSVLAFFSVLMTFIGVNYFFAGMHSYA